MDTAELVSQTATLRRLCALVPATTGVQYISGAQARCTSRTLPSHLAATGLPAATLPPPASSAAAARFAQTKIPRSLGDILGYWGLSKHSALWPGC